MTSGCSVQQFLSGAAVSRGLIWASPTHAMDLDSEVIRFPHGKQAVGRSNFLELWLVHSGDLWHIKKRGWITVFQELFFTAHIFLHCSAVVGFSSQTLRREIGAFSGTVSSMTPSLVSFKWGGHSAAFAISLLRLGRPMPVQYWTCRQWGKPEDSWLWIFLVPPVIFLSDVH